MTPETEEFLKRIQRSACQDTRRHRWRIAGTDRYGYAHCETCNEERQLGIVFDDLLGFLQDAIEATWNR